MGELVLLICLEDVAEKGQPGKSYNIPRKSRLPASKSNYVLSFRSFETKMLGDSDRLGPKEKCKSRGTSKMWEKRTY